MTRPTDRKILPAASLQTESTAASSSSSASSSDDDDEDSFTELIVRRRRRRVQFAFPPSYQQAAAPPATDAAPSAMDPKQLLWYNKNEVALHRKDVQRTIRTLRKHGHGNSGSAHLLLTAAVGPHNRTEPPTGGADDEEEEKEEGSQDSGSGNAEEHGAPDGGDGGGGGPSSSFSDGKGSGRSGGICFRGCERYHSLETRYMAQKLVVDAVLDAQKECVDDPDALRRLSEEISQPGKDLAVWHATLNAFHCYGLSGTVDHSHNQDATTGVIGPSNSHRKHEGSRVQRHADKRSSGRKADTQARQSTRQRSAAADATAPKQRRSKPLSIAHRSSETRVSL